MKREKIELGDFSFPPFRGWAEDWLLLTAGENRPGGFNMMTVAWGGLGVMWGRPLAMVVVRPGRHTFRFMESADSFTLSAFSAEHKPKLQICGTRSGRDVDKVKAAGLTPLASTRVGSPGFDEAELIIECLKTYVHDFDPGRFLAEWIAANYPSKDYHRMYFGEVVAVSGTSRYVARAR